ncbi:histidine phosphatase family protein [Pelagibius sp.]|uniref:histidine phosphatase family protein n=1 Tax=Pelagibius sp. TaxID=1931238 RepID=UPI002601EF43|nr:histidine phosphatase family protein [Pelagibius sp.]
MARILFITHPEVVIDPDVPVPDWPLSETGVARMTAFAESPAVAGVTAVRSSAERKARDGAAILGRTLGLTPQVEPDLHENDRSATGFLPPDAFWPVVERFFAEPETSIEGWERAVDAQARVVGAIERIRAGEKTPGNIAVIAHGGVGALALAHFSGKAIGRAHDQPGSGGGNLFVLERDSGRLLRGWHSIDG